MRIAYFGGDMFYSCMEQLLKTGHEIIALFTVAPNENEYDSTQNVCRQAEALGIPITRSKPTAEHINELQRKGCDMILVAGYSYKIPAWEGESIKYGINIHPSLLPEGAGPMPLPFVITKGLKRTGVTLHKLSQEWDDGDIVLQESFPLFGNENLEGLLCDSQKLATQLLERFLESPKQCWDNASPQTRQEGNYWPMPQPLDFIVCYTDDLLKISRHLRAHRFIDKEGNIEFISGVSFWEHPHNFEPGTILSQKNGMHLVAALNGLVCFNLEKKSSKSNIADKKISTENISAV